MTSKRPGKQPPAKKTARATTGKKPKTTKTASARPAKLDVTPFLLSGKPHTSGELLPVHSPWDNSVVGTVPVATRVQALLAVHAAEKIFPVTRAIPAYQRQHILSVISRRLVAERDSLAATIVAEAGKPIRTALAEVDRAAFTFQVAAAEVVRQEGEVLPLDLLPGAEGRWGMLRRFPIGPVFAITPFNFPLNLVAHKLAPAIAAGCPVLLKPSPRTPLSALALGRIVLEAGWPIEALSVLPMATEDAEWLVEFEDRLKVLSFTGSAAVGWRLKALAGSKHVVLELGGNAAMIVHGDCGDLDPIVARAVAGAFSYSGQSCISVQRIFVERPIFQTFTWKMVESTAKIVCGDPASDFTDVGPVIQEADAERIVSWIEEARHQGAKVLAGGGRTNSLVEPTILSGTKSPMKVVDQEIFGPVVDIEAYDDFDSALQRVNHSRFGLQAGLFTRDAGRIQRAYETLDVGAVIVGDSPSWRIDSMPYGGVKQSGEGREGVRWAIREMTQSRLLVMAL
ncbi:MAG TPA: aldehyde dehydrogenase family protein [Acidisarcina sp.]|nr:aldehyde dehydrogenase family protein [Acidisarcina sp.]